MDQNVQLPFYSVINTVCMSPLISYYVEILMVFKPITGEVKLSTSSLQGDDGHIIICLGISLCKAVRL